METTDIMLATAALVVIICRIALFFRDGDTPEIYQES